MQYFDHDTMASCDDKILTLRLEHGGAAVDAYWAILEQIYNVESGCSAGAKRALSHRLCTSLEQLETWINSMVEIGLFEWDENDPDILTSKRAMENIARYRAKCETARQNAKRSRRSTTKKAVAKQTLNNVNSGRLTGADNKRKEKKGIEIHKVSQIPNSDSEAAAEKTAPLSPKDCPQCGATMTATVSERGMKTYSCDLCGYGEAVA